MAFGDNADEMQNDLFMLKLMESLDHQTTQGYEPVECEEAILQNMRFEEVYIVDYSHLNSKTPKRYFKNLVPDFAIHMCENCCKFFVLDEYEFAYMEHGYCPFCKHVEKEKGDKQVFGSLADMANN